MRQDRRDRQDGRDGRNDGGMHGASRSRAAPTTNAPTTSARTPATLRARVGELPSEDAELPPAGAADPQPGPGALFDRIHRGWIGRRTGAYEAARIPHGPALRDRARPEDRSDPMDRAVLSLRVLELHGPGFTSGQVGAQWLLSLPFLRAGAAEQAAYRNLSAGLLPPETATENNPHAGSDEALARADLYGYVAPGDPRRAARLARKDACVSHTGEGLHAAMWCAALASAAFTARDATQAVALSLRHVPVASRVSGAVRDVLVARTRGLAWERAAAEVHRRHGAGADTRRDASGNACLIAAALLWGHDPRTRIALAVRGGGNIHTTASAVGSIAGVLSGDGTPPPDPSLRVHTALPGQDTCGIRELAERTFAMAETDAPLR